MPTPILKWALSVSLDESFSLAASSPSAAKVGESGRYYRAWGSCEDPLMLAERLGRDTCPLHAFHPETAAGSRKAGPIYLCFPDQVMRQEKLMTCPESLSQPGDQPRGDLWNIDF